MIYRNTKTGCSFETECVVEGGDWSPVPEQEKRAKKSEEPAAKNAENEADMK